MRKSISIFTIICLLAISMVVITYPANMVKSADPAVSGSISRDLEPVILSGSQLPLFNGVDIEELFGYEYSDSSWKQIPLQIDEVNSDGEYGPEDGLLDGNDEVVFMSMDTGISVDLTQWVDDSNSQQYSRYQVSVTNPLDTSDKGWVYIYRSSTLTPPSTDYVSWNEASQEISGGTYVVGLNTTEFFGIESLKVNGINDDILDRSKFRVDATCTIIILGIPVEIPVPLNEESDLLLSEIPDINPDIDGSVRVGGGEASTKIWAYNSLFNLTIGLDIDSLDATSICQGGFKLNSVRVSLDLMDMLTSGMSPTTYYDPNTSGGVIVNGIADTVLTSPAKTWSQISGALGSFVQLIDLSLGDGTISNYYKDNSNPDSGDTGDQKSYGDSGMVAASPSGELSFTMENYILPAAQPNVGANYKSYKDNPLQVNALNQTYDCKPYDVEISTPNSVLVDEEVTFEAIVGKGLEPFTYVWNFGDESSGSGNPALHTFNNCAEYTVNLTVSNTCGTAEAPKHIITIDGCQPPTLEDFYLPLVSKTNN